MTAHAIGSVQCSCADCRFDFDADSMWTPPQLSASAELIQLFDAVTTSRCHVSLHAHHFADDLAEQTLTAWCALHGVPINRRVFTCDGLRYLSTSARLPNGSELVVIAEVRS